MRKILFVCLGNICRSPMAQGIFDHQIQARGLSDKYSCDSAGTAGYHIGSKPDERTLQTLAAHQIKLEHRGRQFRESDLEAFDYILAMDESNIANLETITGKSEKILKMRSFDQENYQADVPDPYYGGQDGFEKNYEILSSSIANFIDFLEKKHPVTREKNNYSHNNNLKDLDSI